MAWLVCGQTLLNWCPVGFSLGFVQVLPLQHWCNLMQRLITARCETAAPDLGAKKPQSADHSCLTDLLLPDMFATGVRNNVLTRCSTKLRNHLGQVTAAGTRGNEATVQLKSVVDQGHAIWQRPKHFSQSQGQADMRWPGACEVGWCCCASFA